MNLHLLEDNMFRSEWKKCLQPRGRGLDSVVANQLDNNDCQIRDKRYPFGHQVSTTFLGIMCITAQNPEYVPDRVNED